jgi:hypothetical protein
LGKKERERKGILNEHKRKQNGHNARKTADCQHVSANDAFDAGAGSL